MVPDEIEELYLCTDSRFIYFSDGSVIEDVSPTGHTAISGGAGVTCTSLALVPYFASQNMPVLGKPRGPDTVFEPVMAGSPHEDSTWLVIRSHKDRLFCFNGFQGTSEYPQRVQWSGPVGSGDMATDWATGDPASTAGWTDLSGFQGEILDAYPLGEFMYVYGAYGVSRLWESGDQFVFANAPVLAEDGVLNTHCVIPISEYGHFVVGRHTIYLFDGHQKHDIAIDRVEQEFRRTLDTDNLDKLFVYPDYRLNEVWICYPSADSSVYFSGNTHANRALVWNYKHNTWAFRDLPNVADMVTLGVSEGIESWDDVTTPPTSWAGDAGTWSSAQGGTKTFPVAIQRSFLIASGSPVDPHLLKFDELANPDREWNNPVSVIGRDGMTLVPMGSDPWLVHHLHKANIQATTPGATDADLRLDFGARITEESPWVVSGPLMYRPTQQNWVNMRLSGTQFQWRITASGSATMELGALSLVVDPMAQR
jgi:hypothetical protein